MSARLGQVGRHPVRQRSRRDRAASLLTFHVMAFFWTYLAITGVLTQWTDTQPIDVTIERTAP